MRKRIRIPANEETDRILRATRDAENAAHGGPDGEGRYVPTGNRPLIFQNKSGATIPAYGCFALFTGAAVNGVPQFKGYKMTTSSNIPNLRWAFNGPLDVPDDGWGQVQEPMAGEFYLAKHDGNGQGVDYPLSYKLNSYELEEHGCDFWHSGDFDASNNIAIVQRNPGQFTYMAYPTGSISRGSSGNCDIYFGKIGAGSHGNFPGQYITQPVYYNNHGTAGYGGLSSSSEIWVHWHADEYVWRVLPIGNSFDV